MNKKSSNRNKNKKGMTLVECIIALAIIVILGLCMAAGFTMTSKLDMKSTNNSKSDQTLEQEIATQTIGEATEEELTLGDAKIPVKSQRHKDPKNGKAFTVFEFDPGKEPAA